MKDLYRKRRSFMLFILPSYFKLNIECSNLDEEFHIRVHVDSVRSTLDLLPAPLSGLHKLMQDLRTFESIAIAHTFLCKYIQT